MSPIYWLLIIFPLLLIGFCVVWDIYADWSEPGGFLDAWSDPVFGEDGERL